MSNYETASIKDMIGKTFNSVTKGGKSPDTWRSDNDPETLIFETEDEVYIFYHEQDCCESVRIESIVGDLEDLIGTPLLVAEESSGQVPGERGDFTGTWTFYKFATVKGWVDVRWIGESNGYYSESVDLAVVKK